MGPDFPSRHLGSSAEVQKAMLAELGLPSLQALLDQTLPAAIRRRAPFMLAPALSEAEALEHLTALAVENQVRRNFLGTGYYGTHTPSVIRRNILENPGWYTQYTPYQAEISQGRLEALVNFQTMVTDLTGLPLAGASLLDEATAAGEAMLMAYRVRPEGASPVFFASSACHPQTLAVLRTRAAGLGIELVVGPADGWDWSRKPIGVLVQYPDTWGGVTDPAPVIARAHEAGALAVVATDLLALTLLKAPGDLGADIAVGNTQRFGVPLGFGGPHAGFLATTEALKREMPGRLVGVSKDKAGKPAYRLALQTREQHIRREQATSNICTAQVLLAVMASMFAVYHGPEGLKAIAARVHSLTAALAAALRQAGYTLAHDSYFDTLTVTGGPRSADDLHKRARAAGLNLRFEAGQTGLLQTSLSLDETTTAADLDQLWAVFADTPAPNWAAEALQAERTGASFDPALRRTNAYLTHPVFRTYHTETEMMRYLKRLEARDLSLTHSMIPLGSCTMKLNSATSMLPITLPGFAQLHPHAPAEQTAGYRKLFTRLEADLAAITGFAAVALQPNSGAQGEYAGLLAIRGYHRSRGQGHRNVCLVPSSAHGTNPASAALAGLRVVTVACDERGNVNVADLKAKATEHAAHLAALMVTYPSTHGVFEESIVELCHAVHDAGGQVYLDGANLNALVGLCSPAELGADVCHLNLHKTFAIPHGGGGPGVGPIAVAEHLRAFLPNPATGEGWVSAAPYGSAGVLPISYAYIAMMGAEGLTRASQTAILHANYLAHRLEPHYPILYRGEHGFVAHECILDLRPLKVTSGVSAEDVAKRLMDYGFHAPTLSFPVAGTLMVEPTESESKAEIDRFCDALIQIRQEIRDVETGASDRTDNPLVNAPHTALVVTAEAWTHPYSRATAAFPTAWSREAKFWPSVGRIDNVWGDRNLFCSCVPVAD